MYPKYQFVYELDPAHDYLPRSISVSILNRKLSQVQVTDFHRLADGRFVPLAAIHETFGFKDGVAGAVVIERTELTVDPSRSTWNEPVVPNTVMKEVPMMTRIQNSQRLPVGLAFAMSLVYCQFASQVKR